MNLFLFISDLVRWLESHMLTCPSVRWFHMQCMGCGMQRSAIALLKGNFIESFVLYPALAPLLGLCTFAIAHLIFRFSSGARIIMILQIAVVTIMLVHYFYKIFTSQIFI